jgi:hypothetical protein
MNKPKLQSLCDAIAELPEKRKRHGLVSVLTQYASQLHDAAVSVIAFEAQLIRAELVFDEKRFAKLVEQRKRLIPDSSTLRRVIQTDPETLKQTKPQNQLASLVKSAKALPVSLLDSWSNFIEMEYGQYEAVARAAAKVQMKGSDKILAKLTKLQQQKKGIPATDANATLLRKDIADVRSSLKDLGLEGKVKEFIEKAATGAAEADLLRQPEVEDFITNAKLWKFLTVRLG